jgi:hypothetical protein
MDAGTCAELQLEVMASLRTTHPNWSDDMFVFYAARFAELMRTLGGHRSQPHPPRHLQSTS